MSSRRNLSIRFGQALGLQRYAKSSILGSCDLIPKLTIGEAFVLGWQTNVLTRQGKYWNFR